MAERVVISSAAEVCPQRDLNSWTDFPDLPGFEDVTFRHPLEALEGFEEFTELTPRASTDSFAAHGFVQSAPVPQQVAGAELGSAELRSDPKRGRTNSERKQFSNRMSQKRFRQKQKVSTVSPPLQNLRVVPRSLCS